jgi:hypothetical protein
MARGDNASTRNLAPENEASATYLNRILLDWRGSDPLNRGSISDAMLVRMIAKQTGKPIPRPTFSSWKVGTRIPSPEYVDILSEFFAINPKDMYEAFGHEYNPPLSFEEFYQQVEEAIEEWKAGNRPDEDNWGEILDGPGGKRIAWEWVLEKLKLYLDPIWTGGNWQESAWKIIGETLLKSNEPLIVKAHLLANYTEFEEVQRHIMKNR